MVVLVRWGLNFTKIREHPLPKDPHRKQMRQLLIPRNQLVPPQGDQRSGGSTQTTQLNARTGARVRHLSILGFALIGLAGIVHRKKGRHEAN